MNVIVAALGYLITVNALTYALFTWDKHQARSAGWRIPESRLLLAAFAGGSPAAKLAQRRLRHKTRKEPFRTQLNVIVALQVAAFALLIYSPVRAVAFDGLSALADVTLDGLSGLLAPSEGGSRGPLPRRFGPGS